MYQLTVFSETREVVSATLHDEYPIDYALKPGQWVDICRIPITDALILEHLLEEEPCFV